MSDIFTEVDEAVRQDRAKTLWRRYGWIAVGIAVAAVGGTAGYTLYQEWQVANARAETESLLLALGAGPTAPAAAAVDLVAAADDASTGRAAVALMLAADLFGDAGDPDGALSTMTGLAAAEPPAALAPLVRVQAALAGVDTLDPAAVEALVAPLADDPVWAPFVNEIDALLAIRGGDTARAAAIYAELAAGEGVPTGVQARATTVLRMLQP